MSSRVPAQQCPAFGACANQSFYLLRSGPAGYSFRLRLEFSSAGRSWDILMLKAMASVAVILLSFSAVRADETSLREKEFQRLLMLGRYGDAERLCRDLDTPLVKAWRARILSKDQPTLRMRGITSFDPGLAETLARESLPFLQKRAAVDPVYTTSLAAMYFNGIGLKQDKALAFHWVRSAADRGFAPAMLNVGLCYLSGEGIPADPKQAFTWVKRAADAGDVPSLVVLGKLYEDGIGTPPNPVLALQFYERAAKAGSIDGMLQCAAVANGRADRALKNKDVPSYIKYDDAAEKLYLEAAEAGDTGAMQLMATYERARLPVLGRTPQPRESFAWCEKASKSGLYHDLVSISCHYILGVGCEPDPGKAERLLKQALAGAKREGLEEETVTLEKLLADDDQAPRLEFARALLAWPPAASQRVAGDPPAGVKIEEPVILRTAPTPRQNVRLVLMDLAVNPSGFDPYVTVEGRVKNVSGADLESVRTSITFEDRNGRLLSTGDAFLKPDPIQAGTFATFKMLGKFPSGADHVKLEFMGRGDRSIEWVDRSGNNAHQ